MRPFKSTNTTVAGRVLDFIAGLVFEDFPAELLQFGADQTLLAKELDRRLKWTALQTHRAALTKKLEDEFKDVVLNLQNEMIKWSAKPHIDLAYFFLSFFF
jgi:hypothetical protein